MKESQTILSAAKEHYEKAQAAWKSKNKEEAKQLYIQALHGTMRAYLVSEGIMHMDTIDSVYKVYGKHWGEKEAKFSWNFGTELDYYYFMHKRMGYFAQNPEFTTDLKNQWNKIYKKFLKSAEKSIETNPEDKFVPPDEVVEFASDVSNIVAPPDPAPDPEPAGAAAKEEAKTNKDEPKKKGFFGRLFGNISVEVSSDLKKKKRK